MIVDLRSDTLTRPTPAMREAMASAAVGDDVWREDPMALRLEERTAELLGKEAALFVPSGTMANQIALLLHCRPGDEVICGRGSHVRLYESGAGAAWAGVQFAEIGEADGTFDSDALLAAMQPDADHAPRTRLVSFENTHNRGGGRIWPADRMRKACEEARALGLALHLDGARIWNAAVATNESERELAAPFDTVSACFSKGLGAPVGSVIAGRRIDIERARRLRKMLGGGMRQIGVLCAAALYALEHHRSRLAIDHEHARRFADALVTMDGVRIEPSRIETNIVIAEVDRPASELCRRMADQGVLVAPVSSREIRAVTHLDVDRSGIERAISVLQSSLAA